MPPAGNRAVADAGDLGFEIVATDGDAVGVLTGEAAEKFEQTAPDKAHINVVAAVK